MADVNVTLYLDCSDKLAGLVEKVTTAFGKKVEKDNVTGKIGEKIQEAVKKNLKKLEENNLEVKAVDSTGVTLVGSAKKFKGEAAPAEPVAEEPEQVSEDNAEAAPELSEADVREKMEAVFVRTEEGLEEADKKKIHKETVAVMKEAAKSLGFDKPSAITDSANRWRFVAMLDGIHVENGKVVPF